MTQIQKGHATATLVLGVCELLCGILVIILAIVAANKAELGGNLSLWWAGVVVGFKRFNLIYFPYACFSPTFSNIENCKSNKLKTIFQRITVSK